MNALLGAIVGFEIRLEQLEGKFKLSQNVKKADFDGAAARTRSAGRCSKHAPSLRAMRKTTAP